MWVALLMLAAVVTGCQSNAIERFEMDDYNPEEEVGPFQGLRWGKNKVAFTAFLSDCQDYGKRQHVKFDQVLLNDGKGYEAHTGIFRAPFDGVYSFTFNVAVRQEKRIKQETRVKLVKNGKTIVGAVAEARHVRHDAMGGNTAIIHVCKGESVWVETLIKSHIEGSEFFRFTTFSGHLLYERK